MAAAAGTEIEIKLRLPSREAHGRVASAFLDGYSATHRQRNVFFDGAGGELEARRAVMRIRFFETSTAGPASGAGGGAGGEMRPSRCVLTLKGKAVITDGVGVASEVEHDIPVDDGLRCVEDPNHVLSLADAAAPSGIVRQVVDAYGVREFRCLGGFENLRSVFRWRPDGGGAAPPAGEDCLHVELDETRFAHGTLFELEVETAEPDAVKAALEGLLRARGIDFSYSTVSKFANFVRGTLD